MTTETEGAASETTTETTITEPGSILFPNEGGDKTETTTEGEKPADQSAGDWKPFEADPAKSDEENAAAKAEHDKSDPASPLNKVPDDGKYEFMMPEGVELDSELAASLMPEFKELGLTQAQANKLVEKYTASMQAKAEAQGSKWAETVDKWAADAKADKEIGGANWTTTTGDAQRAIKAFGNDDLREYLNASGGGNHPSLIRFMAKVGATLKEDSPAGGGDGGGKPADAAHILFPSDAPKG